MQNHRDVITVCIICVFGTGDDAAGDRLFGIARGSKHDGKCVAFAPSQGRQVGELTAGDCCEHVIEWGFEHHQHGLGFWVAETAVEFDNCGAFATPREAGVQQALVGVSAAHHFAGDRHTYFVDDALHTVRGQPRKRRVGTHATGVGAFVVIAHALVVLCGQQGHHGFTIGQRKGLDLRLPAPDGNPRYVLRIEPVGNRVVVGPRESLLVSRIEGIRPTWTQHRVSGSWRGQVQYRAHGAALPATITTVGDDQVRVEFDEPTRGVAPGQSMVFFDVTRVVGSATISGTS